MPQVQNKRIEANERLVEGNTRTVESNTRAVMEHNKLLLRQADKLEKLMEMRKKRAN